MFRVFRIIFTDTLLRSALIFAGGLNAALWMLFIIFLPRTPFLLLSYNIHIGINDTGPWWYAFFLPALGLGIMSVNTALASYFFLKERLISYYCIGGVVVVQCVLGMAGLALVLLNR